MPTIRIMTWNMHNTKDFTVTNLKAIIKKYTPDICCIQEAAPKIGDLNSKYTSHPGVEDGGEGGKGIEIAYRNETMSMTGQSCTYDSIGGQANTPYTTVLQTKAQPPVTVYLTTWHAPGDSTGGYTKAFELFKTFYNGERNKEQVKNAVTKPNTVWIMAGDFNLRTDGLNHLITNKSNYYHKSAQSYPMDHVIIKTAMNCDLSMVSTPGFTNNCGSDCHRPILVDVQLTPPTATQSAGPSTSGSSSSG